MGNLVLWKASNLCLSHDGIIYSPGPGDLVFLSRQVLVARACDNRNKNHECIYRLESTSPRRMFSEFTYTFVLELVKQQMLDIKRWKMVLTNGCFNNGIETRYPTHFQCI